jgi:hypothetical protein
MARIGDWAIVDNDHIRRVTFGQAYLTGEPAVHGIELKEMRGRQRITGDLVDVD